MIANLVRLDYMSQLTITDIYTLRCQVDTLPTVKGKAALLCKLDENVSFLRSHKGAHSAIDSIHRECYAEYLKLEKITRTRAEQVLKSNEPPLPVSIRNYKPGW